MKKSFLTLLLAVLFISGMQAKPVDMQTAKSLGEKFLKANTEIKSVSTELTYTVYADNGSAAFYVFTMQPKGFVIVSADDRAKPILGYSTESVFSAEEIADGLQSFFKNYQAGFSQIMAANEERTPEAVADWERLAATGKINDAKITREVPRLLTSIWNQSALYNDLCPIDTLGPNNHVYAGCVATAMSQIMYYWQWPQTGSGMNAYNCYPYGDLSANFGATTYDFSMMPDYLDWTSRPEEIQAVALLQYHAGISVNMGYSPEGSGAYSELVLYALETYFHYDGLSMEFNYKYAYTDLVWDNMLRENLDYGMPLYYSASGDDGGHAFVCDGYDDNDMFHFNWGWQGLDNGYYPINGFYLSHYSFPDYHAALFGIYPGGEFCYRPLPVSDLHVEEVSAGANRVSFTTPSFTECELELGQLDSVVVMRNNVVVHTEKDVALGAELSFVDTDALGICHYSLTPWYYGSVGMAKKDTILNGPTCELTFHLHDSVGDGWIAESISIVDSRGHAVARLGLTEGSDATLTVEVPSDDELSLRWAYSIGGKDDESYFEVYDWNGSLVYATNGKPTVGELCQVYTDCGDDVAENNEAGFNLYPNPTESQVTIEGVEVEWLEVYNAIGQRVAASCQQTIDLSGMENGLYFFRVRTAEGKVYSEKVIKK